ncbi:Amyloid-beta A4 precursor protein-binding family A member 1 [Holothuria leucospilota]|uniref:Amyloid-beta A4 protein-binding family A member 1 n=1 Tax=Holothuria leucospilota TaxID=206669 RepID=A0A9Q1H163_HOLLE|nr:Amyloid-beta A4 precursor protein-binding family A member 1 [Holothuria leucospilota]
MSGIILMRTAYCPDLVTSTMATQEESQFEDAFEDAESDHQTLKMLTPNGIPPQANGHLIQGKESRNVNGDLPESDIAEADYDPEEYGANGNIDNGDGEGYDDEMRDMEDQYQDEDQYSFQYQTQDGYDEDEGYHQEDGYQEDEQYEGHDQYGMDDQYIEETQYTKEGEYVESERYMEEEDQYYEDDHYGDGNDYVEDDQHQYAMEGQEEEEGKVGKAKTDGIEDLQQEQYNEYDGTHNQDYSGGNGEDVIGEDNVDSNEYAEDDSYNHDNYANENRDSPPEDVSESDQFIDNPDLEEFRPVLGSTLYALHAPKAAESVEEPEQQHENNAEADIPDQREIGGAELGHVDSPLPEEDSKQFIGSDNQEGNVQLQENVSLEPSTLIGGSYVNDVPVVDSIHSEHLGDVEKSPYRDIVKTESDSTEADQQRESSDGSLSTEATTMEPVKLPAAAVPSKTGSSKNQPRPSKPENSMQSKESKELESILHSNLNALIGQKAKSEEQPEPPPVVEEDQGKTRRKPNPEKAIHKQIQGPPKSAQLQAVSPKAKAPSVQRSSPSTRSPSGPRKQGPVRTSKGRTRPQQGGSRVSPARLSEEGVPALRTLPPNRNEGAWPQNVGDSSGHKTGHSSPRSVHGTGRTPEVKGPGSAKPVSALKVMVQTERQKILDLDKILASQGTDETDKNRPVPRRTGQPKSTRPKAYRHSAEYASPSSVRREGENSEELRYSRNNGSQDFHGSIEEPRNNSNGNHIRRPANGNRRPPTRPKSAYYPSSYSRSIEESLVSTPGEVVFDDIAECNAYLQEKEYSIEQRAKSEGDFQRRRRNSYEMANRDSSEDEDPYSSYFSSVPSSHESTIQNVIPGPRANHEVFARLEDDYGADDSGNADDHPDSTQPSLTSDVSTPSTPGSQSTGSDPKPKLPPGINPLEYDAVGLRLAGHVDDSSLSLSSMSTQPVADQFSDADEDVTTDDGPAASAPPVQQSHHQPKMVEQSAGKERKSPQSPQLDMYKPPAQQVDLGKTMKELEKSISTSKSALMKAPSFYVDDTGPSPVWVLQPEVALEQEQEDKRRRLKEEIKKREIEYQRAQRLQRQELHERSDPQCYIRQDEDETEADTDTESKKLMSDEQKSSTTFSPQQSVQKTPGTMRAPDLPPTTGRIKEGRQFTRKVLLRGFSDFVFHQATQRAQARGPHDEKALKTGIRYPAAYLGSTQLITTKQPTRKVRMQQAQEAVNRIKRIPLTPKKQAPEGEEQPSKEVDLAISNERIQVLNADSQETMMDHPLKTISYIADIGNIVVIMARRRSVKTLEGVVEESGVSVDGEGKRQPRKIICHVFETEDAQLIAQTIGQAFALAYLEFLKVNGIDDAHVQEMDYHDVLNSQEIYGDDLMLFSNKECEKEALVEKERGEIMGMVIVESGWGSLVPTVVVANMSPFGAAARSGKLNIGDQIMAINGTSLVGLPIHECQNVIKSLKSQALVKFNIVSCPPVTQVLIKRPDTKYQLGFSVQNGIICSLMRGGIAERGGVRVGHRIIEINGTSVVATPHEKIVDLLSTSVGEIRMKTMPLSMYKLLTGQEQPVYI